MNKKNKGSNKIKFLIIICLVLIVILTLLILILKSRQNITVQEEEKPKITTKEEMEERFTDSVRTLPERERMQTYIAEFMRYIEIGEYSQAYKRLHPDFKERFFKTEYKFIKYAQENYSSLIALEFNNIERHGNYYILTVKVINLENLQSEYEHKYVIQENGLNDYYLSFQVRL